MTVNDLDFNLIEKMACMANRASLSFDDADKDLYINFEKIPDNARKKIVLSIMSVCNEAIKTELAKCD